MEVPNGSPLYEHVLDFIHSAWDSRNRRSFPGPHPVSIERVHFDVLKSSEYLVCEKTDGVRHFLVCLEFEGKKYGILVNRALDMRTVVVAMPKDTLLDGELCEGTFHIFDAVLVRGNRVSSMHLRDRLNWARNAAAGPKFSGHLRLVVKEMVPREEFLELYKKTHADPLVDGYIFTPVAEPVRSETHETMFKWKPLSRITVDFVVKSGNLYIWDSRMGLVYIQESPVDGYEGKIIECARDSANGWTFVKARPDKTHPNNRRTYIRTLNNIRENIDPNEFIV